MSRRERFRSLRNGGPHIMPSLLLCDFGHLEREVRRLEAAGAAALHLDVMDGHFVPNLTYGMPLVAALRKLTDLPLDVHLMITEPARYLDQFFAAGADALTIHVEAGARPAAQLQRITSLGAAAGIAINPATPVTDLADCLELADMVLVMSVPAGFGGQAFHEEALDRLRWVGQHTAADVIRAVDGGINLQTIGRAAAAGADLLVAGSAIFNSDDYTQAIDALRQAATGK